MDSRERVRLALMHKEADRVPIQDSPWGATVDRWRTEGLPSGVSPADFFGFELASFGADSSPQFPVEVLREDAEYIVERNPYGGIRRNHRDYSTTPEIIGYPVNNREDWEKLKDRLQPSDYRVDWVSGLQTLQRERSRGRFITYNGIVGYDKAQLYLTSPRLLKAVIKEPEWLIEMYETDAELCIEMCERMIRGGFIFDGAFLYCDLGYKTGLFFSPKHYEVQLHPVFKKLCNYFKSRNMPVLLHSCGRVKDLIPYFIEEGITCLQPIEVKAGMDLVALKRQYGGDICFMGGIDVRVMAQGDPAALEKEVKEKLEVAKEGGGYIYHSDHSIPKNVSFQTFKLVIDLVKKYGRYG